MLQTIVAVLTYIPFGYMEKEGRWNQDFDTVLVFNFCFFFFVFQWRAIRVKFVKLNEKTKKKKNETSFLSAKFKF